MDSTLGEGTRGILNPRRGLQHFELTRFEVDERLKDFVSLLWSVRWDLGSEQHDQEILPFPRVNLSFQHQEARIVGPSAERFVANLTGAGSVLGVRFEPAGFAPFSDRPMSQWLGGHASVAETFGSAGGELVRALDETCGSFARSDLSLERLGTAQRLIETFLLERCASVTESDRETLRRLNALVERAQGDRDLTRAEQLAEIFGCSLRSLQRLFERYVGVSPKWVLCRARAQEAAERVSWGEDVDWVSLALELGYHDQAHFIRDFKAQIGFTPTAYAARCEAATASSRAP